MPQNATKGLESKKLISASLPPNISQEEKERLLNQWHEEALNRQALIAKEFAIPAEPTKILKYEVRQYGRCWNAYSVGKKGKLTPLLPAHSVFISAMTALEDKITEEAKLA